MEINNNMEKNFFGCIKFLELSEETFAKLYASIEKVQKKKKKKKKKKKND